MNHLKRRVPREAFRFRSPPQPPYLRSMNPADLLSLLLQSVSTDAPFTESAKKIASFIRKTEERFSAPEVLSAILKGECSPRMREYLIFSFLDISRADFDMLEQARPLRQLRRVIHRNCRYQQSMQPAEFDIAAELSRNAGINTVNDVVNASRRFSTLILQISQDGDIADNDRQFLSLLLRAESKALKIRSEWLSDHVDSYDMKAIARLMPLLTVCDELTSVIGTLAGRIINRDTLGRAILTIEYAMRDSFEKWKKKAGQEPALRQFLDMIETQRNRCTPVKYLVPVATLSRRLHAADASPLTWIAHALSCCTADGFRMNIGNAAADLRKMLDMYNIVPAGSLISGSFTSGGYLLWVSHDMLTRPPESEEREPTPKELVTRCLNNDALLLRLLENPKVSGTPGLVEKIAYNSRSLSVLQKIATTRELYSGHANSGVPRALLKNPAHIPFTAIRQFINTRYVPLVDLKEMVHNPYGIRREIHAEIKSYIEQRYR